MTKKPAPKKTSKAKPRAKSTPRRPQVKAPAFVSNLSLPQPVARVVSDLRERGLLPVAVGLVVAILAVPILLSSGSEAPKPEPAAGGPRAAFATAPEAQPVVLAGDEGVRDYKKRLDESASKDPFVQQFEAPDEPAGGEASGGAASGAAATASPDTSGSAGGLVPDAPATPEITKSSTVKFVTWEIDAYVGEASKLKLREKVGRLDFLPNDRNPAAVFLGVSDDGDKALFSISQNVVGVTGAGSCLNGTDTTCALMLLTPGKMTKLWFADGGSYAIKLVRIERVVRDAP